MTFCLDVADPVWLSRHLLDCVYHVSCRRYRPLNLLQRCEVVEKVVFGPPICKGGYTADFGHAFSNRTYFRLCGRFLLSVVKRAGRVGDEEKEERTKNRAKT